MYICKNCYLNLIWSVVHVTETTEKNNLVITDMYYWFLFITCVTFSLQITGLWERIKEHKEVMVEPRSSERVDFEDIMRQFYDSVNMLQDQSKSVLCEVWGHHEAVDLVNMLQDCSMSASIGLLMRFCSLIILHLFCHSNLAISSTSI